MSKTDAEFMKRARVARDKLAAQILHNPDVSLIDIGYLYKAGRRTEDIGIRIHVHESWFKVKPEERAAFPEDIDGIPVTVIPGKYRPEGGAEQGSE